MNKIYIPTPSEMSKVTEKALELEKQKELQRKEARLKIVNTIIDDATETVIRQIKEEATEGDYECSIRTQDLFSRLYSTEEQNAIETLAKRFEEVGYHVTLANSRESSLLYFRWNIQK